MTIPKTSFIDLHTHSNATDGTMAPLEVVRLAKESGLGALALTDHDTIDGLSEAMAAGGAIAETRPAALALLRDIAGRAAKAPLAALIIDYGHEETGFGDTLQAVSGHRYADPLAAPGAADLSAHVDFAALKRGAEALGLKAYGPQPQGEFLLKLGLGQRRDRLLRGATDTQAEAIASGAARLVDPNQMGVLFKVLVLTSTQLPPPPPFV